MAAIGFYEKIFSLITLVLRWEMYLLDQILERFHSSFHLNLIQANQPKVLINKENIISFKIMVRVFMTSQLIL